MASLSGSNSLWCGTFAARHLPKITIVDISLSHANLALTREQMSAMIGRCPGGGWRLHLGMAVSTNECYDSGDKILSVGQPCDLIAVMRGMWLCCRL